MELSDLLFPRAEGEDGVAVVGLAGTEKSGGPFGFIGRVRILLGLEADGGTLLIGNALLAGDRAVQEVTGIDLDAGLVGIDHHGDAGLFAGEQSGQFGDISLGVQHPIVVVAVAVLDLFMLGVDIGEDIGRRSEVERGILDRSDLARGHISAVHRRIAVGVDAEDVLDDAVIRRISGKIEV